MLGGGYTIVNPGFALLVNTGFYSEIENDTGEVTDTTKWLASMTLGENVFTGETRQKTYANDNKVYSFIEVRRENGTVGNALAFQIAVGGRLAVVLDEKAFLYRTARSVDVTGTILSRKTVVVYYPETESGGFVQVKGYDRDRQVYIQDNLSFVRKASLSTSDADVQSAILMHTALSLKDNESVRKAALLESALLEYPGSVFFDEIDKLLNPPMSTSTDAFEDAD